MSISKNLMININMRSVHLRKILLPFLKYTQKRTEKIMKYQSTKLWNNLKYILQIDLLQQTWGGCKKTYFWTLLQQLLKITENYTNEDILSILHYKRIQFAQTYNPFKHWISNYQIPLPCIVTTTITYIMNTPFPSLFQSPLSPNSQYSSSSTAHQCNNPK